MNLNELVELMVDRELEEVHVALPARILKYDPKQMIAEIELLSKKKLGDEEQAIAPIVKVPVAHLNAGPFIIRPPYSKGDIVQVLFNERALDKLLITGKPESVAYKRKHSFDDAVVITGLKVEQEIDLPSEEVDSLYMANTDTKSRVFIRKNGDIVANNETHKVELLKESDINVDTKTNLNVTVAGNTNVSSEGNTTINSAGPATVTAPTTTVNGNVNLAGGGPAVARVGDEVEVTVVGGSSAGKHKGVIKSGSGKTTSG